MACFATPTAVAMIVMALRKRISAGLHIEWLLLMLWGGSVMLIIDHIASGELTYHPPFLTAMRNPDQIPLVLHEVWTVGSSMVLGIFGLWAVMVAISLRRAIAP